MERKNLQLKLAQLEQENAALKQLLHSASDNSIIIDGIPIRWDKTQGSCKFLDLPVIWMWVDTTLSGLMAGVAAMVGPERFALALQAEGRKSIEADWQVISAYPSFEEGFKAINTIASIAGWGTWILHEYNAKKQHGIFRCYNTWEGAYQKALSVCWGSAMLAGKLAGYCSKLHGTNCWATQTKFIAKGDEYDEFIVSPSEKNIESEIEKLLLSDDLNLADLSDAFQKLKNAEVLFSSVFQSSVDGILIADTDTKKFTHANTAICNMLGYSEQELTQLSVLEIHPKESLDFVIEHFENQVLKNITLFENAPVQRKDGSIFYADISATPYSFNNKHYLIGAFRDNTKRRQNETALIQAKEIAEENEQKYRRLVENLGKEYFFYVHDTNGIFTYLSPSVTDMLGYSTDDFLAHYTTFLTENPINKKATQYTELSIQGIKQPPYEVEIFHKDGSKYWLEVTETPLINLKGEVTAVEGIARDITARKAIYETLTTNELYLLEAQKIATIGHYLLDFTTGLWSCSESLDEIFGFDKSTFKDIPLWTNILHPDDAERMTQYFAVNVISNHERFFNEYRIINQKTGQTRWIKGIGRLEFTENGDLHYMFGTIQDISAQKEIEFELMKAKQKAEESEQLKSAFLANMSHEIRTPLNAILGFSGLLLKDDFTKEEKEEYYKYIQKGGKQLLSIVTDIVDISKIEAGQLKLILKSVPLNDMMYRIHSQFNLDMEDMGVELVLSTPLPDDVICIADEVRLTQVISNLIENAKKFTSDGKIEFGYRLKQDHLLEFFVSDTGIGINPEDVKIIFERFRQSEKGHTSNKKGAGLGLSICKGLVKLFNGDIYVSSEVGKGSTFYFTMPFISGVLHDDAEDALPLTNTEGLTYNTTSILIAEDEEANFSYIRALLRSTGIRIIHAENGREAIEKYKAHKEIRLILMDMRMPEIDGYEATRQIRKLNANIPILALTAFALKEDVDQVKEAGCNEYLTKPLDEQTLFFMLHKYLS